LFGTVWIGKMITGYGSFFLTGNFGNEILLRGEECDDPEFLDILKYLIDFKYLKDSLT
jgi:hypothetical protein